LHGKPFGAFFLPGEGIWKKKDKVKAKAKVGLKKTGLRLTLKPIET